MSEKNASTPTGIEPPEKKPLPLFTIVILIALAVFVIRNPDGAKNILFILMGFGAMIFIHELGHFLAAKAVGIKVEEFAIGFGPPLIGWQKTKNAYQLRLWPKRLENGDVVSAKTISFPSRSAAEGDTAYQLRVVPLGGFVKMLGQEDLQALQQSDDPGNYNNKPVWQRMIVISMGVIFNIISGFLVFLYVYSTGYPDIPAIVGDVSPNMPAAQAGLEPGDEIIAVKNKDKHLTFVDLMIAGAFSDEGESIPLTVRSPDGSTREVSIAPKKNEDLGVMGFGIERPTSNKLAQTTSEELIEELQKVGLQLGDTIIAVNGNPIPAGAIVDHFLIVPHQQMTDEALSLTIERAEAGSVPQQHTLTVPMKLGLGSDKAITNLGLQPLWRIVHTFRGSPAAEAGLQENDIIVRFGELANPTYKEIQQVCKENVGKQTDIVVLRQEEGNLQEKSLSITPKYKSWTHFIKKEVPAVIGVNLAQVVNHPWVADCVAAEKDVSPLISLPRGADIAMVNHTPVENWYDILLALEQAKGKSIPLTYSLRAETASLAEAATIYESEVTVPEDFQADLIYVPQEAVFANLPLPPYDKVYQGQNWRESLAMGADATRMFIVQTYLTIKGIVTNRVTSKAISGPVGILSISYQIVRDRPLNYFLYFLGMISMCIAVFNFLPFPILDGGHMVMLIIEKIKGSPVSIRIQEAANYVGLVLIGSLFLYVTFNDVMRLFS